MCDIVGTDRKLYKKKKIRRYADTYHGSCPINISGCIRLVWSMLQINEQDWFIALLDMTFASIWWSILIFSDI